MPKQLTGLKVLIASPSDLQEERKAVREAIQEWNDLHSDAEGVVLLPTMWETHAVPTMGDRPQASINKQIVDGADILIGLFWTKLGTHTGVAASGTVEEIERVAAAGKPVMLYMSNRPIPPSMINAEQLGRLRGFKEETYDKALVGGFDSVDELKNKLANHLLRQVRAMKSDGKVVTNAGQSPVNSSVVTIPLNRRQDAEVFRQEFEGRIINDRFDPFKPERPVLVVSLIPLKLPLKPLVLADKASLLVNLMRPFINWHDDYKFDDGLFITHNTTAIHGESPATSVSVIHTDGSIMMASNLRVDGADAGWDGGRVSFGDAERRILARTMDHVTLLRQLNVRGPWMFGLTIFGLEKVHVFAKGALAAELGGRVINKPVLRYPLIDIPDEVAGGRDDLTGIALAVKPTLDRFWNSANYPADPYINSSGEWNQIG